MVRTIGVDFGLRRVGVAVSSGIASLPLTVLKCGGATKDDFEEVARSVATICRGEGAKQLVVGMPYNSSGGEGEQAIVTRKFAEVLANAVPRCPVFLWDERFSSAEASLQMNGGRGAAKGEIIDSVAAAVILDDFFAAEESACNAAPYVPSSVVLPSPSEMEKARQKVAKRPPPPSASEVRRKMVERAEREAATLASKGARTKPSKANRRAVSANGPDADPSSSSSSSSGSSPGTRDQGAAGRRRVDRYSIE